MKTISSQDIGGHVYVGCSGWSYSNWKPEFYPAGLPAKKFLEFYASRLNSVEVNYTFRTLPSAATVEGWLAQTGTDFRFSFKAPQRISHFQRLVDCGPTLDALGEALEPVTKAGRMGILLVQLPSNFKIATERLAGFLGDARGLRIRVAFEFRHESWFDAATYRTLEKHGAALCVAESDELQTPDVTTAGFACYRLRKSEYARQELTAIRERLSDRARTGDVFAYFKHEDEPMGALRAVEVLGMLRESAD